MERNKCDTPLQLYLALNSAFICPQVSFPSKAMDARNAISPAIIKMVVAPAICPFDRSKNGRRAMTAQETNDKTSNR